jgi:hypothetical protein
MRTLPPIYNVGGRRIADEDREGVRLELLIETACFGRAPIEVCTQE